jgi:hypothetical protein
MTEELLKAIARGELTAEELIELIAAQAQQLGLSVDDAIERARSDSLPRSPLGIDTKLLVELLPAA